MSLVYTLKVNRDKASTANLCEDNHKILIVQIISNLYILKEVMLRFIFEFLKKCLSYKQSELLAKTFSLP